MASTTLNRRWKRQPGLPEKTRRRFNIVNVVPAHRTGMKSGGHPGLPPHAHEDVAMARDFLRDRGIDADTKIPYGDPADELI
jgi:hypothetical protein